MNFGNQSVAKLREILIKDFLKLLLFNLCVIMKVFDPLSYTERYTFFSRKICNDASPWESHLRTQTYYWEDWKRKKPFKWRDWNPRTHERLPLYNNHSLNLNLPSNRSSNQDSSERPQKRRYRRQSRRFRCRRRSLLPRVLERLPASGVGCLGWSGDSSTPSVSATSARSERRRRHPQPLPASTMTPPEVNVAIFLVKIWRKVWRFLVRPAASWSQ